MRLIVTICFVASLWTVLPGRAQGQSPIEHIHEELWAIPAPLPMRAYLFRPLGSGPFPLVVMNHGISLSAQDRGFFPLVEFKDAARWFANRGYLVVAPIRPGYGGAVVEDTERGIYQLFYADPGGCVDPNFRDPGLAIATMNEWAIDYMVRQGLALPRGAVIVGQSGGGWGTIAFSSRNPATVRAMITFAAGRGGHMDGKPNNNCAPDKMVAVTGEFGRTSRVPMLWIYVENDSYFGPQISKRMHDAFSAAGGSAEYHLLPPFGNEGHFFIDSPDAIPIWAPLVLNFLEKHR